MGKSERIGNKTKYEDLMPGPGNYHTNGTIGKGPKVIPIIIELLGFSSKNNNDKKMNNNKKTNQNNKNIVNKNNKLSTWAFARLLMI